LYEYALNLAVMGRRDESLKMLANAIRVDSMSTSVTRLRHAAHVYRWTRQYDRAIKKYEEGINEAPSSRVNMEVFLGQVYLGKKDYLKAIQLQRHAALLANGNPDQVNRQYDALEEAFKQGGSEGYWRKQLELELPRNDQEHLMRLAAIYARVNDPDNAF